VLGCSLDELPPQTRRLLELLDGWVSRRCGELGIERKDFRFSRRELREALSFGDTQLRLHLGRLEQLEYVVAHRGSGRGQLFVYELSYDGAGKDGAPFLVGLMDAATLTYDASVAGVNGKNAALSRAESGPVAGASRGAESGEKLNVSEDIGGVKLAGAETSHRGPQRNGASYARPAAS
jgi:hypothetical protein